MISDMRHILGGITSPEDVRRRWETQLGHINETRDYRGDAQLRLTDDPRALTAYVNHGRWVANCPECNGGIACWPEHDRGACLDCGHVYAITFPTTGEREAAVELLDRRPMHNRNWDVHKGETVERLRTENDLLRGVAD